MLKCTMFIKYTKNKRHLRYKAKGKMGLLHMFVNV